MDVEEARGLGMDESGAVARRTERMDESGGGGERTERMDESEGGGERTERWMGDG